MLRRHLGRVRRPGRHGRRDGSCVPSWSLGRIGRSGRPCGHGRRPHRGDPTKATWCTDNAVDSSDLSALLSLWGSCGQSMMAPNNGAEEESGPPAPVELAEQMGFASIDELVEWAAGLGPEAMAAWFDLIYGG